MRDYLLVIKGQFRTTWRFAILLGWFRKNIPWNSGDEAFHFETSISLSMSRCFYEGAGAGGAALSGPERQFLNSLQQNFLPLPFKIP